MTGTATTRPLMFPAGEPLRELRDAPYVGDAEWLVPGWLASRSVHALVDGGDHYGPTVAMGWALQVATRRPDDRVVWVTPRSGEAVIDLADRWLAAQPPDRRGELRGQVDDRLVVAPEATIGGRELDDPRACAAAVDGSADASLIVFDLRDGCYTGDGSWGMGRRLGQWVRGWACGAQLVIAPDDETAAAALATTSAAGVGGVDVLHRVRSVHGQAVLSCEDMFDLTPAAPMVLGPAGDDDAAAAVRRLATLVADEALDAGWLRETDGAIVAGAR